MQYSVMMTIQRQSRRHEVEVFGHIEPEAPNVVEEIVAIGPRGMFFDLDFDDWDRAHQLLLKRSRN